MKKIILVVMIISGVLHAQTVSATGAIEAASGDPIWVILNHVKADKRAQFEKFVYEVLLPALEKNAESDPISKNIILLLWLNLIFKIIFQLGTYGHAIHRYIHLAQHDPIAVS